jgi:hypothetical protein
MNLRLAEQQCSLERPPLDRRELGQDLGSCVVEQVGQPHERELGLGLRRPRRQDPVAAGGRGVDAGQPHRRLAYACLARQQRDAR